MKYVQHMTNNGVYRITIPTVLPTGDTHCYFGEGDGGWTVIDAGTNTSANQALWAEALKRAGINFKQIRTIYLTHNHLDHFGLAGWLQQQSDAEVLLSEEDSAANEYFHMPEEEHLQRLSEVMRPYGISDDIPGSLVREIKMLKPFMEPFPVVQPMPVGESFRLGDDVYEILAAPGHTAGHVVFLGQEHRRLFSGDVLCSDRVSQISEWPYLSPEDPLGEHLQSLQSIVARGVADVCAGHGAFISDASGRLREVENEHDKRIGKAANMVSEAMTLPEICRALGVGARSHHEMRVSWGDTRAYLEHLVRQGKILKSTSPLIRYYPRQA